jgi:hypothetical protein
MAPPLETEHQAPAPWCEPQRGVNGSAPPRGMSWCIVGGSMPSGHHEIFPGVGRSLRGHPITVAKDEVNPSRISHRAARLGRVTARGKVEACTRSLQPTNYARQYVEEPSPWSRGCCLRCPRLGVRRQ